MSCLSWQFWCCFAVSIEQNDIHKFYTDTCILLNCSVKEDWATISVLCHGDISNDLPKIFHCWSKFCREDIWKFLKKERNNSMIKDSLYNTLNFFTCSICLNNDKPQSARSNSWTTVSFLFFFYAMIVVQIFRVGHVIWPIMKIYANFNPFTDSIWFHSKFMMMTSLVVFHDRKDSHKIFFCRIPLFCCFLVQILVTILSVFSLFFIKLLFQHWNN